MDYPVITSGHLSQLIKSLRKTRGLTQAGLGALLGLKQVRIAEIENDPARPMTVQPCSASCSPGNFQSRTIIANKR